MKAQVIPYVNLLYFISLIACYLLFT